MSTLLFSIGMGDFFLSPENFMLTFLQVAN